MALGDSADAQAFMSFYVTGSDPSGRIAPLSFPGIRRRTPAVVGPPTEYELDPNPDDGTPVTDAALLSEAAQQVPLLNPQRCVFRDLCGLEEVVVRSLGSPTNYELVFLWCSDYPASVFPTDPIANPSNAQPSDGAGRVFVLDASGQSELVVAECLTRFREFLGDGLLSTPLIARTVAFPFEQLSVVRRSVNAGTL